MQREDGGSPTTTRDSGRVPRAGPDAGTFCSGRHDGEQTPHARDAAELVQAAILEDNVPSFEEVAHSPRHQNLARPRSRGNPSTDVDREAADPATYELALAGVQPRTHLEPQLAHAFNELLCASDPSRRRIERREEAVASRVDLTAAGHGERSPEECMMPIDEIAPSAITEAREVRRRSDDVGEQHRGEHTPSDGHLARDAPCVPAFVLHGAEPPVHPTESPMGGPDL
jgi:hypothetical protein